MKVCIFLALALALALAGIPRPEKDREVDYEGFGDLDLTEEEFEEEFGLDPVTDPEEKAKREKALEESEDEVKKENKKFLDGEADWFEQINEFSDLPEDEFEKEKTGDLPSNFTRGFGLITPKIKPVDEESERYIESLLARRASVPASYSAVSAGLVSSVKSQGDCGSCVAFASMAAIETCLKKASGGKLADFSEQQLVDCGYGKNGAEGCNGAQTSSYIKYVADNKLGLTHESIYGKNGAEGCNGAQTSSYIK